MFKQRRGKMHLTMRVYFEDEAPRIGAGWRTVHVTSLGYKWARLKCAASGRGVRIRRAVFDQLAGKGERKIGAESLLKKAIGY
jgi:hypothetical protein